MALVWTTVILTGALSVSFFQYRNEANLYRITKISGEVQVIRDGQVQSISYDELVPGGVIIVTEGLAYCDMALVNCGYMLVDESALTGEATPVGKNAVDSTIGKQRYNYLVHKRETVMAGTAIVECDECRAIALHTASYTSRGELIRDIYSFKRHQFKFDAESPIVVTILALYSIFGFA